MFKKFSNNFNKLAEDKYIKFIFILLILFLISFFFYNCDISLWADEFFSIERTKQNLSFFNVIQTSSLLDTWPPLFYILLHLFQLLFGNSEIILRAFIFTFNILSLFLLYLFTKFLYTKKEAILTCIFFTFSPYILSYGFEIRGYSLFLLLSILSSYLLLLFIRKQKNSYLFFFFLFSILLSLTHYFGLLLTLFQTLYLFFENYNSFSKNKILFILFLFILFLYPSIHLNTLYFKHEIFKHNTVFADTIINRNYFIIKELFPQISFNIINTKIETIFIYISILFFFYNIKNKNNRFILFLCFIPLLSVNLFAYFFMSFLHVRYFIFIFPLVYIMLSHFVVTISNNYFYIIITVLLLFFCFNIPKIDIKNFSNNDREQILLLKNFSKDKIIVLHSKLYFINYYLDKYNIKNYPIDDINTTDFKTNDFYNLIKEYKYVFIIYPFSIEQNKELFEKDFKLIEITEKLYVLSKV